MRSIASYILVLAPLVGCSHLEPLSKAKLTAPTVVKKNGVVLDVLSVRFPLGDPSANDVAWKEIDELQVPSDARRKLETNGLRVGVISGPLPLELESLLQLSATAPIDEGPQTVDLDRAPTSKQRQLHIRGGRRSNIIVMGERQRREELSLLLRTDDSGVKGRTYQQVMGMFAARAFPKGDGGVSLEMTPELEHGTAQKRFTPGDGMFKVEFGPPHEVLDQLRWSSDLAPGQLLAVTTFPNRPGTLGHHFFTEREGDRVMQKMLLVRLVHCEFDDRFSDGPAAAPADDP